MAKRHEEHEKRKDGGKAESEKKDKAMQVYNAKGSHEEEEADDEEPDFKKGGKVEKKKAGGHVKGEKAEERMDRPKREHHAAGGRVKRKAGGHSPYSSGHNTMGETDTGPGRGHEGVGATAKLGED